MSEDKKDCMFQYGLTRGGTVEDTGLVTRAEADALWEKYQGHIKSHWDEYHAPQMCIWVDCINETDYSQEGRSIDYRECELVNGTFYKVTRKPV